MPDPMHVHPEYAPLVREIGLTDVFADPRVRVWRTLPDRQNGTLDQQRSDGSTVRLHVKRYVPGNDTATAEVAGHALLESARIPTAPLVAHGRSFAVFADLAGYTPADKLVAAGTSFEGLLFPTADLAAALHAAGLHHRDMYLCHFMVRPDPFDVRLIDVARVARMANPLTRRRWVVKDLAQFWYSTTNLEVTDQQRTRWLDRYAERRGIAASRLIGAVRRKSDSIGRHDEKLNRRQPTRNVSLPVEVRIDHEGTRPRREEKALE
jgi:hypothetical protein